MASTADDSIDDDYYKLLTLIHECDSKETLLKTTRTEIEKLQSEVENLKLEKEWCLNNQGERVVPTAKQQALKICQQIALDPDLLKDFVKALRIKKIDLQSNINQLKEKCETLRETDQ